MSEKKRGGSNPGCAVQIAQIIGLAVCYGFLQKVGPVESLIMVAAFVLAVHFVGWGGALAALVGFGLLFIGVQPSAWLSAAIALAIIFTAAQKRFGQPRQPVVTVLSLQPRAPESLGSEARWRMLLSSVFKGLRETAIGISLGLAVALTINCTIGHIDPSTIDLRGIEASLLYLQITIGEVAGAKFVLMIFLGCLLIALLQPTLKPMGSFVWAKQWIDRIAIPLTVLCSFTLYTSGAHTTYQGLWALAHRKAIVKTEEEVRLWRQSALAAARAEDHIEKMSPTERANFSHQYRLLLDSQRPLQELSSLAADIGTASTEIENTPVKMTGIVDKGETEDVLRKVDRWRTDPRRSAPPTRKDVRLAEAEANRAKSVYSQARDGLATLLETQLDIPVENGFVKPFVDSLVASMVDKSMDSLMPDDIPDVSAARRWWVEFSERYGGKGEETWHWNVGTHEKLDYQKTEIRTPEVLLIERTERMLVLLSPQFEAAGAEYTERWEARPVLRWKSKSGARALDEREEEETRPESDPLPVE